MKKNTLLLFVLLYLPLILAAQQNAYVSPGGTQYLLYTPPSYTTGTQTHPLLISLHGKGEMGTDLTKLTSNNPNQQPSRLIYLNRWPKDLPFIVLSPLFTPPVDDPMPQWPAAYIDEVVKYVTDHYRVDMNRIYVTGLSLGGTGTWTYASAYPQKVAAILPISGRSDLTKACPLKNIPAWVFHSDGDRTVTYQYSIDLINAINSCKTAAVYRRNLTTMWSKDHYGWSEVYNGSNGNRIYEWLLKFTKGNTTNTSPYVNAGPDRNIMVRSSSVHLYGDYFDSDGTVSTVLWKQISGTPLTLANTNSPFLKISNLQAGTFEFELSATDNMGATATDRVIIKILSSSTLPAVTNIVLMNGMTNADVKNLTELMTVNKAELGLSQINLRAEATSSTQSVRYSINADQHTRTINAPGPYYLKPQSTSTPEWEIRPGHYVICATAYATTGASGTPGLTHCVKVKVIDDPAIAGCEGNGKIFREIWPGISGTSVASIPVTLTPTAKTELYSFESPTDVWDNFGERIRGYICPPATGSYSFWISSNDDSELWLSTDATAANKRKIAYVNGLSQLRRC
jgi:predicted esterase